MKVLFERSLFVGATIVIACMPIAFAGNVANCAAAGGVFGRTSKTPASIAGNIYYLPEGTSRLPDFSRLKSVGKIYAKQWDIHVQDFKKGFPGVSDRFEWFAIDYRGKIYVANPGRYGFRVKSDDGAILYLDGKKVFDNDGIHAASTAGGSVKLSEGEHDFRLSYFQGPRYQVALRLWVTPPGKPETIFRVADYTKSVQKAGGRLKATETANAINLKLDSAFLFDFNKATLKPSAGSALKKLAEYLNAYPGHPVVIAGYTDSVGSKAYNLKLSRARAESVAQWLTSSGAVADDRITTEGYGESDPVGANATKAGRAKNRRVEIHLSKQCD